MKILIVVQRYYPSIGGTQKLAQDLAESLVKSGNEVTVVTTNSMNQQDVFGYSFTSGIQTRSINYSIRDYEIINGVKVYRFTPKIQLFTYMLTPSMWKWFRKHNGDFDVVHAFCYMFAEPDFVALIKTKYSKWKFILEPNDIQIPESASLFLKLVKKLYDETIGKITLTKADKIIMLASTGIKQLLSIYSPRQNQVIVIPPGISLSDNRPTNKIINRLLFVGRYVEYKGAQHILRAVSILIKLGLKDVTAVFVGEDQGYLATLKKISKELNIEKKVRFYEKLPNNLLRKEYDKADYFVLPSTNEGFGIVAIEAADRGCIPILIDYGGLSDIIKNVGCLKIDKNKDIAIQISNLVSGMNNSNKSKIRSNLKHKIKEYSWSALIRKYEKVYE